MKLNCFVAQPALHCFAVSATLVLLSACGTAPNKEVLSDIDIVGGQPVPESRNDVRRTATVALTTDVKGSDASLPPALDRGSSFCTATIIAKNAIVTAAHCLQKFDAKTKKKVDGNIFPMAEDFIVYFGTQVSREGTWIRAKRVVPHPDWNPTLTLQPAPASAPHDIGVIVLSEDIPEGYEVAKIAPLDMKLDGGAVYLAGFGVTKSRNKNDTGTLREVETKFQSLDKKSQRLTVGAWGRGACAGDSGGPAYVKNGNNWFVTGATSTGPELFGRCIGVANNYTDIRYYTGWIAQEIGR